MSAAWRRGWAAALLISLLLAGCGSGSATPEPTRVAATTRQPSPTPRPVVVVTATLTATTEPSAPPATPVPAADTATPEPTSSATATEGPCANDAEFVSDLSVPDGTQFLPGQPIGKQWAMRNNGTCDWDARYRLVLVSGNALGARSEHALFPARAGASAVFEISMAAPAEPGTYTGRWQARDPEGNLFGDRIFITIEVVVPAPPTDTPAPEGGG